MLLNFFNKNTMTKPLEMSHWEQDLLDVCYLSPEAALVKLEVTDKGLDSNQVDDRRERFGWNATANHRKAGVLQDLYHRIKNPLVIQLLVIGLVSLAMGDLRSAIVVGSMALLSVGLGYYQESRADRAVEKLQAMVQTTCVAL